MSSNRHMKLTPAEKAAFFRRYDRRCLACGRRASLQIDHVQSLADGGDDTLANAQPLSGPCNQRKGSRSIDFRGWRSAVPLQLVRRVRWRPQRSHARMEKKMIGALARVLALLVLALFLVFAVPFFEPIERWIAYTLG
jgi:hypothetical protein